MPTSARILARRGDAPYDEGRKPEAHIVGTGLPDGPRNSAFRFSAAASPPTCKKQNVLCPNSRTEDVNKRVTTSGSEKCRHFSLGEFHAKLRRSIGRTRRSLLASKGLSVRRSALYSSAQPLPLPPKTGLLCAGKRRITSALPCVQHMDYIVFAAVCQRKKDKICPELRVGRTHPKVSLCKGGL